MKNKLFNIYLLGFFLLSDFIMFAQTPGSDSPDGDLEGGEEPEASINSKLILLGIAGIIYVYYTFYKKRKLA